MAVSLLCGLGCWQLSRAAHKRALIETYQRLQDQPPLNAEQILQATDLAKLRYYPVKLQGVALNNRPILLDNAIENGQVGYRLYVPVMLNDTHVILVERDFIPLGPTRARLPENIPVLSSKVIEGVLDFAYRNRFVGSVLEPGSDLQSGPIRVQTLDTTLLSQLIGKEVYPMLIIPRVASGKAFPISPQRHNGYAVQWFGLALVLVIISLVVYRKQSQTRLS